MKLFAAQLLFLICASGARALHIRSPPRSITNDCPSAQEVKSSTFTIDGNEILRQTFTCPEGNFTAAAMSEAISTSAFHKRTSIEVRSQAECTTPSSECQCGTATECGCFNNGPAPSASDCNTLIGSTAVLSTIEGPTFLVQPNTFEAITLNSCSLGFLNLASTTTQYCWDDLATAGNAVVLCISELEITSGLCVATDQRYFTRLGPVN